MSHAKRTILALLLVASAVTVTACSDSTGPTQASNAKPQFTVCEGQGSGTRC